jgi:signal transduction histidine kinase
MRVRLERFLGRWWSVTIAVLLGGLWLAEAIGGSIHGSRGTAITFAVLVPLAFAFVRWFGFWAALVVVVLLYIQIVVAPETLYTASASGLLVAVTAGFFGTLARLHERVIGLVMLLAGTVLLILRLPESALGVDPNRTAQLISNLILFTIAWTVAWVIAGRVRSTRDLRDRAAALEAERDHLAREAVTEERSRIARELHDVVAHSVSVMTVQAGGVRRLLRDDQQREREALAAIEETGRRALAEMRRMVGVMRTDANEADRAPQPGLGSLERLVGEVREAGLPVTFQVEGERVELPVGVDLSAYRIVQEGLTNTLKHAGPAHAWVTVRYVPEGIDIVVEDDGAGPRANGGSGHGLIGMSERVAVYGGRLETGVRPGGGFRLHAVLPVDGAGREASSCR